MVFRVDARDDVIDDARDVAHVGCDRVRLIARFGGELADLLRDDGKAPALLAGARRFDRSVEGQEIRLRGDFRHHVGDGDDLLRLTLQGVGGVAHGGEVFHAPAQRIAGGAHAVEAARHIFHGFRKASIVLLLRGDDLLQRLDVSVQNLGHLPRRRSALCRRFRHAVDDLRDVGGSMTHVARQFIELAAIGDEFIPHAAKSGEVCTHRLLVGIDERSQFLKFIARGQHEISGEAMLGDVRKLAAQKAQRCEQQKCAGAAHDAHEKGKSEYDRRCAEKPKEHAEHERSGERHDGELDGQGARKQAKRTAERKSPLFQYALLEAQPQAHDAVPFLHDIDLDRLLEVVDRALQQAAEVRNEAALRLVKKLRLVLGQRRHLQERRIRARNLLDDFHMHIVDGSEERIDVLAFKKGRIYSGKGQDVVAPQFVPNIIRRLPRMPCQSIDKGADLTVRHIFQRGEDAARRPSSLPA